MGEQITVFDVMKTVLLWLSPLVFLEGILLLILKVDKHTKLEHHLSKEVGGIKKRLIPKLETNIYSLQNWLVKRTIVLGLFFIIYSLMLFVVLVR